MSKVAHDIKHLQVRNKSRTEMESATFETTGAAVDLAVLIWFDVIKSTKCDFSTTILVPPPVSPLWGSPNPSREESASHHRSLVMFAIYEW